MKASSLVFFATLLAANGAFGQTPDVAKADALFREGRAAMKAGDLRTACPKLEESYRLDPTAGTAVNLGDCFDKQGKVGSALLAYRAARKLLKPGDKRIAPVDQQTVDLEKRVPRLTITLAPDAPEGVTVTRDGRAVDFAELGTPFPVNPGRLMVVATASGHDERTYALDLSEGETRVLVVDAGAPNADSATPAATADAKRGQIKPVRDEPSSDGSTQRTVGYVVGAVGAVFVGVGVASALKWKSKRDESNAICPEPDCPDDATHDRFKKAQSEEDGPKTWTTLGFGLGVGALAGGLALILLAPDPDRSSASTGLLVSPRVSGRSYGMGLEGLW